MLLKIYLVKAMVFPVVTYACEGWTIKKFEPGSSEELMFLNCVVLEKTLESSLDFKELKLVNPKRNQY